MENYKKYLMQNSELILKSITELKDPLSFLTDVTSIASATDGLKEFEVVLKGNKVENYEIGDIVLCRKDIAKPILHNDFQDLFVVYDERVIFSKLDATSNKV